MLKNTHQVLFPKDQNKWFVAVGDNWMGPMKAARIYRMIEEGLLSWAHFVWCSDQKHWKRLCQQTPFARYCPDSPSLNAIQSVQKLALEVRPWSRTRGSLPTEEGVWYLYQNSQQQGPFFWRELCSLTKMGKVRQEGFLWRTGWKKWVVAKQVKKLVPYWSKSVLHEAKSWKERRRILRKPFQAKVFFSSQGNLYQGLGADVSVRGMRILIFPVPVEVGDVVKFNITPEGEPGLSPWACEGKIVRILEDQRGFGIQFQTLSRKAKNALEVFVEGTQVFAS